MRLQPSAKASINLPGIKKLGSGKVREVSISVKRCSSSRPTDARRLT
jgi:hypothetical protein